MSPKEIPPSSIFKKKTRIGVSRVDIFFIFFKVQMEVY